MYTKESHSRSMMKTASWRLIATFTTALLVFVFTGNLAIAAGVGAFEIVAKLFLYYFHERVWNHVRWGRLNS